MLAILEAVLDYFKPPGLPEWRHSDFCCPSIGASLGYVFAKNFKTCKMLDQVAAENVAILFVVFLTAVGYWGQCQSFSLRSLIVDQQRIKLSE